MRPPACQLVLASFPPQFCVGGFAFHQLELQPVAVAFGQLCRDAPFVDDDRLTVAHPVIRGFGLGELHMSQIRKGGCVYAS